MSRRDTIIIAVLINTGMLAILFMMAIHSEDEPGTILRDVPATMVEETSHSKIEITDHFEPIALAQTSSADEIDNALKEYQAPLKPTPIAVNSVVQPPNYKSSVIQEKPMVKIPTSNFAPKVQQEPRYVEVTIKRGDCLGKIALANNTTVREIKDCNQMTSERIDIGQVLRVPVNTKVVTVNEKEKPDKLIADGAEYYTMRRGDNPWKIAKQFHVDFDEFLRLNELDEEKARNLKIGDRLRVK